jgi:hypothetical protein
MAESHETSYCLHQGCTNPRRQVAVATNFVFFTVAPNICGPSICNLDSYRPSGSYNFEVAPKFLKTRHVRTTKHRGAFAKPFLPWKSNKCYGLLRVCARVVACVRVCARARSLAFVGA